MKIDLTNQKYGRFTAKEIVHAVPRKGNIWRCECERGNAVYKTISTLRTGKVLSYGCLYKQTRSDTVKYRRDLGTDTSISNIVASKRLRSNNTSGHTGVWHDKKHDRWHAFINFQGKQYNPNLSTDSQS